MTFRPLHDRAVVTNVLDPQLSADDSLIVPDVHAAYGLPEAPA